MEATVVVMFKVSWNWNSALFNSSARIGRYESMNPRPTSVMPTYGDISSTFLELTAVLFKRFVNNSEGGTKNVPIACMRNPTTIKGVRNLYFVVTIPMMGVSNTIAASFGKNMSPMVPGVIPCLSTMNGPKTGAK